MADVHVRDHNPLVPAEFAMRTLKASQFDLSQQIAYSGDRVEKFIPLPVIALAMAAEGVRRSQGGGGSLFDPLGQLIGGAWHTASAGYHKARGNEEAANESIDKLQDSMSAERFTDNLSSMVDFENKVRFEDPLTGGLLYGEGGVLNETLGIEDVAVQEDPSLWTRGLAGLSGALQGLWFPGTVRGTAADVAGRSGAKATQRQAAKTASEIAEDVGRYADDAAVTTTQYGTPQARYEGETLGWDPRLIADQTTTIAPRGGRATTMDEASRMHGVPYREAGRFRTGRPEEALTRTQQEALENLRLGGQSRFRDVEGNIIREADHLTPYRSIDDPRFIEDIERLNVARPRSVVDETGATRQVSIDDPTGGTTMRGLSGISSGEGRIASRLIPDSTRGARRTRFGQKYGRQRGKARHGTGAMGWRGVLAGLGLGLGGPVLYDKLTDDPGGPDGPGGGVGLGDGYGTGSSALGAGGGAGAYGGTGGVGLGGPQGMYSGHGGANVGASIGGHGGFGGGAFDPFANVATQNPIGVPRRPIWDPSQAHHFNKTGEKMKIGERMLKQAEERMYKAVCPACGKANCNCKEYKNKEEKMNEKDSKKPAHGMVIVIGSKAGPGPSKEGKRQKLDSEKKDE